MAIRPLPEIELLRKLLDYDPATGVFIWKTRQPIMFANGKFGSAHACKVWNTKNAGKRALDNIHGGAKTHLSGQILGQMWLAHRVAWAMQYSVREFDVIDHINGNGWDNRIENLRVANQSLNARNARLRKDSESGSTGVRWHIDKRHGNPCWTARIQINGKRVFLGSFTKLEDAIAARENASRVNAFGPAHGKDVKNARPI